MGEDIGIVLDPMAPPSPIGVSGSCQAEADEVGGEKVVTPNTNGTAHGTESEDAGAPETPEVESHDVAAAEGETDNLPKVETEIGENGERASGFPEENLTEENNTHEVFNTVAATDFPLENSSDKPPQELEAATASPLEDSSDKPPKELEREEEAVVEPQETAKQEEGKVPVLVAVEKPDEVADVMDVDKQDEVPASSDDQQQKGGEVTPSQAELLKQEVAHRTHIFGSLSKLDDNSARQLLNDSGWNVSQSVRMNGKTQWYYRSPPPKPVLLGSLTSAVALWKKAADEDHKRKGGGDDDLYPMVTAFINNGKRPAAAAKKRKRGRVDH